MLFNTFLEAVEDNDARKVKDCFVKGLVINDEIFAKNLILKLAQANNIEMLKTLFKFGLATYVKKDGVLFLDIVMKDNIDIVELCLTHGANVNYQSAYDYGSTALHIATKNKNVSIVKLLLNHGASLYIKNCGGCNSFVQAIKYDLVEIVKIMLDHDAKINSLNNSFKSYFFSGFNLVNFKYNDRPILFKFVSDGCVELVEKLLKNNASVDVKDKFGKTPLMYACNINIVKLLLEYGAQVNAKDDSLGTSLMYACYGQDVNIVKLLLEHGAQINVNKYGKPICIYNGKNAKIEQLLLKYNIVYKECSFAKWILDKKDIDESINRHGDSKFMLTLGTYVGDWRKKSQRLLDKGANINHRNYSGRTALIEMCSCGQYDYIKFLLEHGADVNIQDRDGITAIMALCSGKYLYYSDVKLLLDAGAMVDLQDNKRNTALMYAIINGNIKVVETLLEHGASTDITNKNGENALYKAVFLKRYEIVKMLLDKGSFLDVQNNQGLTPLIVSASHGDEQIMNLLLERGASVNIEDNSGSTALDRDSNMNIINTLVKYGAIKGKGKPSWTEYLTSIFN